MSAMSFSKAKLKRFNEVTDSPHTERFERKDSIRRFLREQFQHDKKPKETTSTVASSNATATIPVASDAEHSKEPIKSKISAYRLFRTPSLPRRLRFNRHDLTPKEKSSNVATTLFQDKDKEKEKDVEKLKVKEALHVANEELKRKNEALTEVQQQIDTLKTDLEQLNVILGEKSEMIQHKDEQILELEKQIVVCTEKHQSLKCTSEELKEKICTLEEEIRMILKNHENEVECLTQKNTRLTAECEKLTEENRLVLDAQIMLKNEFNELMEKHNLCSSSLEMETKKLQEKDQEYRKLLDENIQLLDGIERIKKQADEDMLTYAIESKTLLNDLETTKNEMSKIITELCLKEELVNALQEELSGKDIEMDVERDELKSTLKVELDQVEKKYEDEIRSLKENYEQRIVDLESSAAMEKSELQAEHVKELEKVKEDALREKEQLNELAEEKIRISEIQAEQKIKSLEIMIEQSIQKEKDLWKSEINKCQKIAESEIMQSEFEKQDLKTLLESANELMLEKDEKIAGLKEQLDQETTASTQTREMLEIQLKEKLQECNRLISERYNYQLALRNTRSTVNILMDRLKKSDKDVEILKAQLENIVEAKNMSDVTNARLNDELKTLTVELEEYRVTLNALRNSSLALEREMFDKESVFEKIMSSEEETLETVNKIGKLFNDKLEENISKYAELYNDIKKRYDARETYIKDMKALLEEFATGIELARLELDMKDKQLAELQDENKNIKLEIMTYKFKCEQLEKYEHEQRVPNPSPDLSEEIDHEKLSIISDETMVSNQLIENIIVQLEKEANNHNLHEELNSELFSDEDKISAENYQLKEKLSEKIKQIEFLQEMVEMENGHATENLELRRKINELEQKVELIEKFTNASAEKKCKEKNSHLKNLPYHDIETPTKENPRTPLKLNMSHGNITVLNTPKTPKTPKTPIALMGKENQSPLSALFAAGTGNTLSPGILRIRNN